MPLFQSSKAERGLVLSMGSDEVIFVSVAEFNWVYKRVAEQEAPVNLCLLALLFGN